MADEQSPWLPTGWPNMPPSWNRPQWAVELEGLKHLNRELTEEDIQKTESWEKLYTAEVGFCGNVPLNASQQNQYHFETMAARVQYFKQKLRLRAGVKDPENYVPRNYYIYNNTAQIRDKGVMLVGTAVRNMESCNYLFIHNKYQENADIERQRWYFCFITRVEYVAPSTTAVYYEVDPIQTYWLDLNMKPSYIERMTPDNDNLFGNTTQEGLDTGPLAVHHSYFLNFSNLAFSSQNPVSPTIGTVTPAPSNPSLCYAIFYTTPESDGETLDKILWIPLSINRTPFNPNNGFQDQIQLRAFYQQQGHQIIANYLVPTWIANIDLLQDNPITINASRSFSDLFGGYIPKNKKLYCHPFSFLEIQNNLGGVVEFRWEFFDNKSSTGVQFPFGVQASLGLMPEATIYPKGYLGESSLQHNTLTLSYNDFPNIPWTSDAFNSWFMSNISRYNNNYNQRYKTLLLGQTMNMPNTLLNSVGSIGSSLLSAAEGSGSGFLSGATAAGGSLLGGMANDVQNEINMNYLQREYPALKEDLLRTADSVGGWAPGSMFNLFADRMGITFRYKTVTPEYAFKIDSFFTKRGYYYGCVMTPTMTMPRGYKYFEIPRLNIFPRTNTQMEYGVPSNAILKIQQAFANGITFWAPPPLTPGVEPEDTVGNYGTWMPNPPAT